jgi:hypothetical protein
MAVDPLLTVSLRDGGFELRVNLRETICFGELSVELRDRSEEVGEEGSSTTKKLVMRTLEARKVAQKQMIKRKQIIKRKFAYTQEFGCPFFYFSAVRCEPCS